MLIMQQNWSARAITRTSIRFIYWLIWITVCLVAICLLYWRAHGQQVMSIQTGSMVPTFRPGDGLIVRPVNPNNLQVGEVISYHSLAENTVVISHRLRGIDPASGWLITQGDALSQPDPTFPPRLVVGQATAVVPYFGKVLTLMRQPLALGLLIYLPACLIVINETRRLSRYLYPTRYRVPGY